MKLVILGVGGMGAISLSKILARVAINKNLTVKSTEIHGMAKKGGLVEIYMKIGEGASPYIPQKEADFCIVLERLYYDYALNLVKSPEGIILLKDDDKVKILKEFGDIRFANSFILGKFFKKQNIFDRKDAVGVLSAFKMPDKNIKAFYEGVK